MDSKLKLIAKSRKSFGVKGYCFIELLYPDFPFHSEHLLTVRYESGEQELTLEEIKTHPKTSIKFKEINSLNELNGLLPFEVYAAMDDVEIDKGIMMYEQLRGACVINASSGKYIGEFIDFYSNGAQYVLCVRMDNGQEFEVPHVDAFVKDINLLNKEITIIKPIEIE